MVILLISQGKNRPKYTVHVMNGLRNNFQNHSRVHEQDSVFQIRIHVFFGLPDPDPLVRDIDPDPALDPEPSIIMQKL